MKTYLFQSKYQKFIFISDGVTDYLVKTDGSELRYTNCRLLKVIGGDIMPPIAWHKLIQPLVSFCKEIENPNDIMKEIV